MKKIKEFFNNDVLFKDLMEIHKNGCNKTEHGSDCLRGIVLMRYEMEKGVTND